MSQEIEKQLLLNIFILYTSLLIIYLSRLLFDILIFLFSWALSFSFSFWAFVHSERFLLVFIRQKSECLNQYKTES